METLWFALVALMLAMYVLLDGFDLGAGAIHPFIASTDTERRMVYQSIGPVWDGNEVWIVIGGGVSLVGEDLLFSPLRQRVAERVFKPFAGCYEIVPAALGEEMVVHGALALARKRLGD